MAGCLFFTDRDISNRHHLYVPEVEIISPSRRYMTMNLKCHVPRRSRERKLEIYLRSVRKRCDRRRELASTQGQLWNRIRAIGSLNGHFEFIPLPHHQSRKSFLKQYTI